MICPPKLNQVGRSPNRRGTQVPPGVCCQRHGEFWHANSCGLITIIVELRAQGVTSLNAIAKALTEQGVPTARGSSTWTAAGVSRVLKLIE